MQKFGMDWTILQPHHFMQNLLTQTEYIINEGVVYAPSGDGKIPYIDARDVAAVAAVTLAKPRVTPWPPPRCGQCSPSHTDSDYR